MASSSPLCAYVQNVRKMEDAGIGAVVLQSLFEEQIKKEQLIIDEGLVQGTEHFAEALSYLPDIRPYCFRPSDYMEQIIKTKEAVDIPVIGSLNGANIWGWIKYAREMEKAGADAIELNIYNLPVTPTISSSQVEQTCITLVREVVKSISIPVSVKIGPFFSSIPEMISKLSDAGAVGWLFSIGFISRISFAETGSEAGSAPEHPMNFTQNTLDCFTFDKIKIDFAVTVGYTRRRMC